jgi:hypothetical protein
VEADSILNNIVVWSLKLTPVVHDGDEARALVQTAENLPSEPFEAGLVFGKIALEVGQVVHSRS